MAVECVWSIMYFLFSGTTAAVGWDDGIETYLLKVVWSLFFVFYLGILKWSGNPSDCVWCCVRWFFKAGKLLCLAFCVMSLHPLNTALGSSVWNNSKQIASFWRIFSGLIIVDASHLPLCTLCSEVVFSWDIRQLNSSWTSSSQSGGQGGMATRTYSFVVSSSSVISSVSK